ncbi:MAG: hypothetical protein ACFFCD_13770 [Promethearchaeota archaeon]
MLSSKIISVTCPECETKEALEITEKDIERASQSMGLVTKTLDHGTHILLLYLDTDGNVRRENVFPKDEAIKISKDHKTAIIEGEAYKIEETELSPAFYKRYMLKKPWAELKSRVNHFSEQNKNILELLDTASTAGMMAPEIVDKLKAQGITTSVGKIFEQLESFKKMGHVTEIVETAEEIGAETFERVYVLTKPWAEIKNKVDHFGEGNKKILEIIGKAGDSGYTISELTTQLTQADVKYTAAMVFETLESLKKMKHVASRIKPK